MNSLRKAEKAMEKASDTIPLMQILCHRLMLRKFGETIFFEPFSPILQRLNEAAERFNEPDNRDASFVLALAIIFLTPEFPMTVTKIKPYVYQKVEPSANLLRTENIRGIEPYRDAWETDEDSRHFETFA